jgi:hypothetical protein
MRTVDLALYADVAAARASALEARLERARDRIRRAAIEREARRALSPETAARLQEVGLLSASDLRAERREVSELAASLAALRELQTWVEARLADAESEAELMPSATDDRESRGPPRAA